MWGEPHSDDQKHSPLCLKQHHLDIVSYTSIDTASQANVEMLNVNEVAYGSPHQSFSNYPTVDLSELKEITLELATLFSLPLPKTLEETNRYNIQYQVLDKTNTTNKPEVNPAW